MTAELPGVSVAGLPLLNRLTPVVPTSWICPFETVELGPSSTPPSPNELISKSSILMSPAAAWASIAAARPSVRFRLMLAAPGAKTNSGALSSDADTAISGPAAAAAVAAT